MPDTSPLKAIVLFAGLAILITLLASCTAETESSSDDPLLKAGPLLNADPLVNAAKAVDEKQLARLSEHGVTVDSQSLPATWVVTTHGRDVNDGRICFVQQKDREDARLQSVLEIATSSDSAAPITLFNRTMLPASRIRPELKYRAMVFAKGTGRLDVKLFEYGKGVKQKGSGAFSGSTALGSIKVESKDWKVYTTPPVPLPNKASRVRFRAALDVTGNVDLAEIRIEPVEENAAEADFDPDDPAEVVRALRTGRVSTRRRAARVLAGMTVPDPDLLPVLEQALGDADEETRYAVLHAIAAYEEAAAPLVPDLIAQVRDGSPPIKVAALYALSAIGPEAAPAAPVLVEMTGYKDEHIRTTAHRALANIGAGAREELLGLLRSPDKVVALTTATTLRTMPELLAEDSELAQAVEHASPTTMLVSENAAGAESFEEEGRLPADWTVHYHDGAEGEVMLDDSISRSGKRSLKITKTNGKGVIEIRSKRPVTFPANRAVTRYRLYFHSDDAPVSSGVLLRFRDEKGTLWGNHNPLNGGRGLFSQSLARNAAPGEWVRRVIVQRNNRVEGVTTYAPSILVQGNPHTVWIDDVQFPAPPRPMYPSLHTLPRLRYSREEALALIEKRQPVTADIRRTDNGVRFLLNGKPAPLVLHHNFRFPHGDYPLFDKAGVHLQTLSIPLNSERFGYDPDRTRFPGTFPVWNDDGSVDVSNVVSMLERFARMAPHSSIILAFHVAWPKDYVNDNPETAWLDRKGKRMAGTTGHLYKPDHGGLDTLVTAKTHVHGPRKSLRWWPSMHSEKARQDAAEVIRQVLAEIKKTPYADMVAGTMIMGGHDGQFTIRWPDDSESGRQAWRRFLRKKYGTDENLAAAWGREDARIETASVPPVEWTAIEDFNSSLYDPVREAPKADYKQFMAWQTWDIQDYFAGVVKEAFDRPTIGITWQMSGFDFAKSEGFLASEHLDAFVTQPSYELRQPGYVGGYFTGYESLLLHDKMTVSELDLRTWFRGISSEIYTMWVGAAESAKDFGNIARKEAGRMLARGQGWWFFDISKSAYRHPAAVETIGKTTKIASQVVTRDTRFSPDVAVVYHAGAENYNRRAVDGAYQNATIFGLLWMFQDIASSGVPYDNYYFDDLKKRPDLCDRYKVFVFVAPYPMDEEDRRFIETHLKRDGKILVWHYAPGYITPEGFSIDAVKEVTGMSCRVGTKIARQDAFHCGEDPLARNLRPQAGMYATCRAMWAVPPTPHPWADAERFTITDSHAVPLARYDDGETAIAVRRFDDWTSVYVAGLLGLGGDLLNAIAREADAYVLCEPGPAVELNGAFMSVSALVNGPHTFTLPRKANVTDAWTGETIATDATTFTLDLQADQTRWLLID